MANPQVCIRFDPEKMKVLERIAQKEGDKNAASLVRRITNRYLNESMQCKQMLARNDGK